jgi:hypothetical protein
VPRCNLLPQRPDVLRDMTTCPEKDNRTFMSGPSTRQYTLLRSLPSFRTAGRAAQAGPPYPAAGFAAASPGRPSPVMSATCRPHPLHQADHISGKAAARAAPVIDSHACLRARTTLRAALAKRHCAHRVRQGPDRGTCADHALPKARPQRPCMLRTHGPRPPRLVPGKVRRRSDLVQTMVLVTSHGRRRATCPPRRPTGPLRPRRRSPAARLRPGPSQALACAHRGLCPPLGTDGADTGNAARPCDSMANGTLPEATVGRMTGRFAPRRLAPAFSRSAADSQMLSDCLALGPWKGSHQAGPPSSRPSWRRLPGNL